MRTVFIKVLRSCKAYAVLNEPSARFRKLPKSLFSTSPAPLVGLQRLTHCIEDLEEMGASVNDDEVIRRKLLVDGEGMGDDRRYCLPSVNLTEYVSYNDSGVWQRSDAAHEERRALFSELISCSRVSSNG